MAVDEMRMPAPLKPDAAHMLEAESAADAASKWWAAAFRDKEYGTTPRRWGNVPKLHVHPNMRKFQQLLQSKIEHQLKALGPNAGLILDVRQPLGPAGRREFLEPSSLLNEARMESHLDTPGLSRWPNNAIEMLVQKDAVSVRIAGRDGRIVIWRQTGN